jgi:hypothetical protein
MLTGLEAVEAPPLRKGNTMNNATVEQVRKHYEDRGCEVRIDDDGHVEFSRDGTNWSEGRWVSEYRIVCGQVVLK